MPNDGVELGRTDCLHDAFAVVEPFALWSNSARQFDNRTNAKNTKAGERP
jgi:hypothetical protein